MKKILIWVFLFLALVSFASAFSDPRFLIEERFNSCGNVSITGANWACGSGVAKIHKGAGGTDSFMLNNDFIRPNSTSNDTNFSITLDINVSSNAINRLNCGFNPSNSLLDSDTKFLLSAHDFGNNLSDYNPSSALSFSSKTYPVPTERFNYTLEVNTTGVMTLKFNDTVQFTGALDWGRTGNPAGYIQRIFCGNPTGYSHALDIEVYGIYEKNISCGTCTTAGPPANIVNDTKANITVFYPLSLDTINNNSIYPFKINGSVRLQNGSVNLTINRTDWKNQGNQTDFNFTFNGTYAAGRVDIMFIANSTPHGNVTTYNLTFYMDLNTPTAISNIENNLSLFYVYGNITFQINMSDNLKLYSFNISTPEGFGDNKSGVNTTNYIYNGSINTSTYTLGRHNLTAYFCDAHTKNKINNWQIDKDNSIKEIKFNVNNGFLAIRPQDTSLIQNFDAEKQEDRYIFRYFKNPSKKSKKQAFIVSSSENIDIVGNEKYYKGWLVINNLKKWIDFNINEPNINYKITRIDGKNVLVELDNIQSDNFTFNSAGDLNCNNRSYQYYLFNYTATFSNNVIETTKDLINLKIDFADIFLKGNGTLNYSGIGYNTSNLSATTQLNLTLNFTIPQVINNETNVTFFWDFFLNNSEFISLNFTQLVQRIRLASCGPDSDIRTLNISIFNEQNIIQPLKSSVAVVFTTWTNDSGITLNFTFNLNDQSNYSICIFPNTSVTSNAYFQYNTTGGYGERWYLTNARLTTNTSLLNLYNFNSQTGISLLNGVLRDTSFSFFPNVVTKLQRRYLPENLWRTVQMDKSDNFGQVIFHIIEQSQDYRMIYEKDGLQIDSSDSLKFVCTSAVCNPNFIVRQTGSVSSAKPSFKASYDNISQMFQLNFTDTTGLTSSVRLLVTKETGLASTTICDTSLSSSSGTINCNTTGQNGNLVYRVYSSASPETPKLLGYITKAVDKFFQKLRSSGYEKDGVLFASGITITLTLAGLYFTATAGIIMYILGMIITNYLGLANFITNAFISTIVVLGIVVSLLIRKRSQ